MKIDRSVSDASAHAKFARFRTLTDELGPEHGYPTPCHVICEPDVEATRRAFPEMQGEILRRQAIGAAECVFKYERPAR